MISDVLDFSKLESGRVEFEHHRVRLPEIAESLVAMLGPRAEMKGLRLEVDLPPLELGTDPARLRQVLVNLIGNAVKFTADGSVAARGGLIAPDRLRVEITDTGIGIAPEGLPLLFRDFSQVDGSASRSFGGSGLGLAICKRIVEGLQGRIGVESRLGQGSTFWIELPVDAPQYCGARTPSQRDPADAAGHAFAGRVLVVEDNPINWAVAKGLLDWLGVEVAMVHNGAEAVDILEHQAYDLVLMDVQMPVMSGIEATQAIRRRGDRVRIVGLTGNAFTSDRQDCLRAGMDDFVPKPVTQDKLAQVLAEAGLRGVPAVQAEGKAEPVEPDPAPRRPPLGFQGPVVDEGLVVHLLGAIGAETVVALLDEVLAEADGLSASLEAARRERDDIQIDALLHSFKGAAATLGLAEAARLAQVLRTDPHPSPADLILLQMAAQQGAETIRGLCGRGPATQAAA
ncbi:ATP-binding protein [Rubellimicrobium roseum]|uniref:histidine kinase n=1 Tax=Rubellimicrobium roseum TaxID=687525 RepID=A0A5C4NEZ1_9RHOB|nr:ATP-binding protein [Rubellimicrobium roseum]TNC70888.1 response regulator [Rubellimicrobium roseum]